MYRTIMVDCQTKTDTPYCEDCIAKKTCIARLQRQRRNNKDDLNATFLIEILA